jgi:hypothetical protein
MLAIANAAVSKIADLTRKESIITMRLKTYRELSYYTLGNAVHVQNFQEK